MTTLTFTHGIVSHSTDTGLPGGTANFLVINSDKVDINAPLDQPLVAAFAHRDANYLITLQSSSDIEAWGYGTASDFNQGMDNVNGGGSGNNIWYLYIEIDRVTGQVTYGHSIHEPGAGSLSSAPYSANVANRPDDLHWFDTTDNTMKVWRASGVGPTYGKWVEVIRLFVAKYTYSASFTSLSANSPSYIGTTVGKTGSFRAGSLVFDVIGNPLARTTSDNHTVYFTTEDVFLTGMPSTASPVSGNRARYETFLVDAIGVTPAPAYSIVRLTGGSTGSPTTVVTHARPLAAVAQGTSLWGMIEFPIGASGDLVQVTMSGVVRNPLWNWSGVGIQVYVDKDQDGLLTTTNYNTNQVPVGVTLDKTSILLRRPELALTSAGGSTGVTDHGALTGLAGDDHLQYHTDARANAWLATRSINGLGDVVLTGSPLPASGDVLTYNGSNWVHQVSSSGVSDHTLLTNIGTNTHAQIDTHIADSTIHFTKASINLTDLGDVVSGSPATGNVLTWDGARWEPQAPAGGGSGSPTDIVSRIEDADGDTYVDVELTSDSDNVVVQAGDGSSGGDITITAGDGSSSDGGDIRLTPGEGSGYGSDGSIYVQGGYGAAGAIRFNDDNDSNYIEIISPGSVTYSRTWTLPDDNPASVAGQFITTNASGELSFAAAGGGGGSPVDLVSRIEDSNGDTYVETDVGGNDTIYMGAGEVGNFPDAPDILRVAANQIEIGGDLTSTFHFQPPSGGTGATVTVSAGEGGPAANGGSVFINGGPGGALYSGGGGSSGNVRIETGDGTSGTTASGGSAGDINLYGGNGGDSSGHNAGQGSDIRLAAGDGGDTSVGATYRSAGGGGNIILNAGNGGAATGSPQAVPGDGGVITLRAGSYTTSGASNGAVRLVSTSTTNDPVELRFYGTSDTRYSAFRAEATPVFDTTYILPPQDGTSGQVLTTAGTANLAGGDTQLSWGSVSLPSGTIPYDIAGQTIGSVPGGGGIDAEILRLKLPRAIILDSGFVGSPNLLDFAEARVGPTATFTLRVWVTDTAPAESTMPATGPNGIANPIAEITFDPGSPVGQPSVGSFDWAPNGSPITPPLLLLPAGTTIVVEGVDATDATLADIFFTIVAYQA